MKGFLTGLVRNYPRTTFIKKKKWTHFFETSMIHAVRQNCALDKRIYKILRLVESEEWLITIP